jgi:hypothetical protein
LFVLALALGACDRGPAPLDATVKTCTEGIAAVEARAEQLGIESIQADQATGQVVLSDPMDDEASQDRRGALEDIFTSTGSFVARHGVSGVPLFVGSPKTGGWSQGTLGARLTIDLKATPRGPSAGPVPAPSAAATPDPGHGEPPWAHPPACPPRS